MSTPRTRPLITRLDRWPAEPDELAVLPACWQGLSSRAGGAAEQGYAIWPERRGRHRQRHHLKQLLSWTSEEISKAVGKAAKKGEFGEFGEPVRVRTEGGYIDYTDKWPAGVGSGEATQHMLQYVNKTPEIRAAFNNNPYIAERAMAKLERDEAWASKWGATRPDIQNARRILSEGPGGIDRLEAALKKGAIALPVLGAILAGGTALLKQGGDHEGL